MNKLFNIFFTASIGLFAFQNAKAQTLDAENMDSTNAKYKSIDSTKIPLGFPSLETVIDSVLKRSAMVDFRKNNIGAKESALASERVYWSKNLGIQADTRFGNLNNFSSNEDGEAISQVLTTTKQFNYSVGFFLKFPLFDGINRKHQIKLAKFEVDAAKNMVEFEKEQIRKNVIVLYQNLILKQRILQIKSRSLGDVRVNMQMVEKEFRNGIVPIAEYVRISGITTSMETDYETAISEFITAKKLLEDMAGFVFGLTPSN